MVLGDLVGGCVPDASWVIVTSVTDCSFLNTCTKMEITTLCISGWKGELCCSNNGKFKVRYYAYWLKIKVKTLFQLLCQYKL